MARRITECQALQSGSMARSAARDDSADTGSMVSQIIKDFSETVRLSLQAVKLRVCFTAPSGVKDWRGTESPIHAWGRVVSGFLRMSILFIFNHLKGCDMDQPVIEMQSSMLLEEFRSTNRAIGASMSSRGIDHDEHTKRQLRRSDDLEQEINRRMSF